MKFIILTTPSYDCFEERPDVSYPVVNPEHIVLMKGLGEYGDYATEVELSNGSVLLVYETIQEIRDMITEG